MLSDPGPLPFVPACVPSRPASLRISYPETNHVIRTGRIAADNEACRRGRDASPIAGLKQPMSASAKARQL
jgi:hypothetical protein